MNRRYRRIVGIIGVLGLLGTTGRTSLAAPGRAEMEKTVAAIRGYDYGQSEQAVQALDRLINETFGNAALRKTLEQELVKVLQSEASMAAKQLVCKKLAIVGTEASVPALARLLTGPDPNLAEMACYALLHNPSPAAGQVLRDALSQAKGKALLAVIAVIGDRGDEQAVQALGKLAESSEPAVFHAAMTALGKISGKEAAEVLSALRTSGDAQRRAAAQHASLQCAQRLAARGAAAEAKAIYQQLMGSEVPLQVRRGALVGQAGLGGPDATALVLATLKDPQSPLKAAAIASIPEIRDRNAGATFAAILPDLPADEQVLLIDALAGLDDPAVRPAMARAAQHPQPAVRMAALAALGKIGDASCVPILLKALAGSQAESETAAAALRLLRADGADAAVLKGMQTAEGKVRAELIRVLADRRAGEAVAALWAEATSEDPVVRTAAIRALGVLASERDFAAAVKLLTGLKTEDARPDAEQAVAKVAARFADRSKASEVLLAALDASKAAPARCSLLRVLGTLADERAYAAILQATKDPDAEVQNTAVRVLADWPDARAVEPLLALVEKSSNPTHRTLALRGYVRLLGASKAAPAELAAGFARAMVQAASGDDRKLILGAVAKVPHRDALKLATEALKHDDVRTEAAIAAIAIASKLPPSDAEVVCAAMEAVASSVTDAELRAKAKALIRRPPAK